MTYIDSINLIPNTAQPNNSTIKVIGVGGGGCNAVTRLYNDGIDNVELLICNTDTQPLQNSPVPEKLQLGTNLTKGLGAGCDPERGRNAALESVDDFKKLIGDNIELVFITAGMGGGTGTGAAPVLAKAIREMDNEKKRDEKSRILIVGVVTYPFEDEGREALERAYSGVTELIKYTDCILIVDNQKMYETCMDSTLGEAYKMADDVLDTAVRGIADIVEKKGYVNVDMNDMKTVMRNSGMVIASTGKARGENRSKEAVENAFISPLLVDFDLRTAKNLIVNFTFKSLNDLKTGEVDQSMQYIKEFTGDDIEKAKKGLRCNEDMDKDELQITIVATGFKFYLNPPTKKVMRRNEEDILVVNQDEESDDNSIIFATPLSSDTETVRMKDYNPAFTTIFTPDMKITDFETEPALVRRERLKKEYEEKQKHENN